MRKSTYELSDLYMRGFLRSEREASNASHNVLSLLTDSKYWPYQTEVSAISGSL